MLLVCCLFRIFAAPCGDVNSSGTIDIVDALLIAQYYVGLNPANFDQSAADVNGDGGIDIVDALLIAQYYVGLITSLPGCAETPSPTNPPQDTQAPTSPPSTVTLQAEDAYYNDAVVETEHAGYTGSGYVNTTNASGTYIEWSFNASTGNNAECMFTYANGADASRPMELSVNGSSVISSLDFPANGAWDSWVTVSATVYLNSGTNTIRLTSLTDEGAPNLDKLDISFNGTISTPEPTQTPVPTSTPAQDTPPRIDIANAPAPLYDDPVWHGATDTFVLWNAARGEYFMYYTQRRATLPNPDMKPPDHGSIVPRAVICVTGPMLQWLSMIPARKDPLCSTGRIRTG